jgi:hypothetical protein
MVVFILLNQSFLPFQQQSHRFLQFEPLQCGHVFSCVAVSVGFNMAIWQILHSGWETSDFILQGRKPKLAIKVGTENIFYPIFQIYKYVHQEFEPQQPNYLLIMK